MNDLVPIKRVIDFNVTFRVKYDNSNVYLINVKMALNPFCEIAVEEAVRLKEAGTATKVIAISIGDKSCQEQLSTAFALGADRDNNQIGQILAALTELAQGTFASEVKIEGDKVNVTPEVDSGLQTIALNSSATVTTALRLNEPSYASLPI